MLDLLRITFEPPISYSFLRWDPLGASGVNPTTIDFVFIPTLGATRSLRNQPYNRRFCIHSYVGSHREPPGPTLKPSILYSFLRWEPLGASGTNPKTIDFVFIPTLGATGSLWEPLRASGSLWGPLGASGSLWEPLGASGSLWEPLGASGSLW
jgi:hypothetical protein